MMQALALLPEKIRQRRRVRQRILDPGSPRKAFANPKYGSTSRNFIFRVMATKKVSPAPIPVTPPYQEMQEGEKRAVVAGRVLLIWRASFKEVLMEIEISRGGGSGRLYSSYTLTTILFFFLTR